MMRTTRRAAVVLLTLLFLPTVSFLAMADSEESIAFGEVPIGETVARRFTYTVLESSETAAQVSIHTPCPPFGLAGLESQSMTLAPGQFVTFDVTFAPTHAQDYSCTFTIEAAGGYPVQVQTTHISLSGRGVGGEGDGEDGDEGAVTVPWTQLILPWLESLQTGEASGGSGLTDAEGRFEVSVPPSTTVAGQLSECGGNALSGVEVQVVALEEAYGVVVSGFFGIEVEPTLSMSFFGMKSVDLGSFCVEALPPAEPLTIRLLSPMPGDGVTDGVISAPLCWESLGAEGVTYQVIVHSTSCDPQLMEGPHPFAPLIPDPQLDEQERDARRRLAELRYLLENQSPICENLSAWFDNVRTVAATIPDELAKLRDKIAEASAAQVGGVDIPLPSSCPVCAEDYLAPDAAALLALQIPPCFSDDPCQGLRDACNGLQSQISSLHAHAVVAAMDASSLVDYWVDHADHRGVMSLYNDYFSLIDEAISLIGELIDTLTAPIESAIRSVIDEFLDETVCQRYPELCERLEQAESAKAQLEIVRSIMQEAKSSGSLGPAFIVQMYQAMAQQAAAATGVAVAGWEVYAQEMTALIQEAYESTLCLQSALAWILDHEDDILDLCEACLDCLRDDVADAEEALAEVEAEQQAAAATRQAYWQEQQALINAAISQVGQMLTAEWYEACCGTSPNVLEIPGSGTCAEKLEDALKTVLGDQACFLTFRCTIDCQRDSSGEVSSAAVNCTYSFPLTERREDCCVPSEDEERTIGTQPDPGQPGETVCRPPDADSAATDPDGWSIEGLNEDGELIASSPIRPFRQSGVTAPSAIPRDPRPPTVCTCTASASINGIPLTAAGPTLLWTQRTPANIVSTGDCGPMCAAGSTTISVLPPAIPPLIPGGAGFVPLPVSVMAGSMGYDFPREGVYTITVTQSCEDGQQCSATYTVEAVAPPGPVARPPGADPDDPAACPACGSNDCLRLATRTGDELPSMPLLTHVVPIVAGTQLELELTSRCQPACEGDRTVRWEITHPDGTFDVLEAVDLYAIPYLFDKAGIYALCVIETVTCDGRVDRFENWWQIQAAPAGG